MVLGISGGPTERSSPSIDLNVGSLSSATVLIFGTGDEDAHSLGTNQIGTSQVVEAATGTVPGITGSAAPSARDRLSFPDMGVPEVNLEGVELNTIVVNISEGSPGPEVIQVGPAIEVLGGIS